MLSRALIVLVSSIALAVLGGSHVTRAAPNDLVGTWRLVLYEDRPAGGAPVYPYGRAPIGLLVYDATGHMAVQITEAPKKLSGGRGNRARREERPASAYTAYFGTYTVDWTTHVITHTVEGNLYPVYVGTSHERPFDLDGDRLTLKPRWQQDGKRFEGIRVFERLK